MDSQRARQLYYDHANAVAYVDVERPDGARGMGSAFHIGEGVFVTARHVVENNRILEIKITEPVAVSSQEYFRSVLNVDVTDEYIQNYDHMIGDVTGSPPLFKRHLKSLQLEEGPRFSVPEMDVAVFRVKDLHSEAGVILLGAHWDDWVYRRVWHLTDAIILGYPPIPMVNYPVLVAARAEIHTFVVPRHAPAVHFILSATPRGGFSGGVAIHEDGNALGLVTSSFVEGGALEQSGFFAVLSIEAIVKCLEANDLYPNVQKQRHRP